MMKPKERQDLLKAETPPPPGTYACTVPGCDHKVKEDGWCPRHNVPLRFLKRR